MRHKNRQPPAIILCHVLTGYDTVRGIASNGIETHAVTFTKSSPVSYSRYCKHINLPWMEDNENALIYWLLEYSKKIESRPVVIPTSDAHALMLAKHYDLLSPYCRLSTTSYHNLLKIINKGELYTLAGKANVDVIPAIHEPTLKELMIWSDQHAAPYLLKPFYQGIVDCSLKEKNLTVASRDELLNHVMNNSTKSLIIQRMIHGGDGFIFDSYGLCGADGKPIVLASHRRLRQFPINVGTTTYGEIPCNSKDINEADLFENTERLLAKVKYHGIFGIEWLQDKVTGELYLIDFNARPFSSIGHLMACGLNLPYLAYQELIGVDISSQEKTPQLKHKLWMDILRDIKSYRQKSEFENASWSKWFKDVFRCRSFAYWSWSDIRPGLYNLIEIMFMAFNFVRKKFKR